MLSLNTLKPAKGSTKNKKRVGRGNASGHGTYSTKGLKGQKARSGVSRYQLKRLGMKPMLLNLPKVRGFKSDKIKEQVVNIGDLNKFFKDKAKINPRNLCRAGLIKNIDAPVKILGRGEMKIKEVVFEKVKLSTSAKDQLAKSSSQIIDSTQKAAKK